MQLVTAKRGDDSAVDAIIDQRYTTLRQPVGSRDTLDTVGTRTNAVGSEAAAAGLDRLELRRPVACNMKTWTKKNMQLLSSWRKQKQSPESPPRSAAATSSRKYAARVVNAPFDEEQQAKKSAFDDQQTAESSTRSAARPRAEEQEHEQSLCMELIHYAKNRSRMKKIFSAVAFLVLIPVVLDLFVMPTTYVEDAIDSFLDWMGSAGIWGVWGYIACMSVCTLFFIPPSIFVLAAGFTFQSVWGFSGALIALLSSFIAGVIGGLAAYYRARYISRDVVKILKRRYPILRATDKALAMNGLKVMFLIRLNPLIPFGVSNYVFGCSGVDPASYTLAIIGMIPWWILLIFIGAAAETALRSYTSTAVGMIIVVAGIVTGIIALIIVSAFARKELQKLSRQDLVKESGDDLDASFNVWSSARTEGSQREIVEDYGGVSYTYQEGFGWQEVILDDFS